MIWLKDSCTQNILDFISVAWGDLSNVKLLWELSFQEISHNHICLKNGWCTALDGY